MKACIQRLDPLLTRFRNRAKLPLALLSRGGEGMTPELNCAKCGGNRFRYPPSIHDATPIACEDCGHSVGTFGQLRDRMAADVLSKKRK